VVVAFAVSWLAAAPLVLDAVPPGFHLAVALGPAVAAVAVTAAVDGRRGLVMLWRRVRDLRRVPSWRWWLVAVSPLAFFVAGVAVAAALGTISVDDSFDGMGWPLGLVGASVAFGVLEELGWRGFLLPRVQVGRTASRAALVVWLLWGAWHLPMFAYHFDVDPMSVVGWSVGLYFGTVLLTSLHNSTGGSLLAVMAFHVTFNLASISAAALSSVATTVVSLGVVVLTIGLARWGGPADLSRYGRFESGDDTTALERPTARRSHARGG